MRVDKDFAPATPSESRDYGFDYSNDLALGETLVSALFTLEVYKTDAGSTADASPNTRKVGGAVVENSTLTGRASAAAVQRVANLQPGNTYNVIGRATTSGGQILELSGHVLCRAVA